MLRVWPPMTRMGMGKQVSGRRSQVSLETRRAASLQKYFFLSVLFWLIATGTLAL